MVGDDEFHDDPTPVDAGVVDPCISCEMVPLVRIRNDVRPPGCEREARAFMTCVSTQDGRWAVCAAKFLVTCGGFVWYFGPERRAKSVPLPGMTERRAR